MCTLRSLCCLYKSPKWHILGTKTVQQKSHESWPCVSAQGDPVPNTGHSHYKPVPFIPQKNINRQRKFFPSTWLFQNEPNWESWKRSLGGHRSLARRGHMRRGQLLCGRGGCEGALQVHRLVEQFVTDEDDQGKEAELEVAAMLEKTAMLSAIKSPI